MHAREHERQRFVDPGQVAHGDHDNPAEMTGETIAGRYRLLEPLGRSAMSAVWLAHDDELERQVAVKMLAAERRPRPVRT